MPRRMCSETWRPTVRVAFAAMAGGRAARGAVYPYERDAAKNRAAIAAAGGIEPLIALLGSPSVEVQNAAAGALYNLACIGACRGGCAGACGCVAPYARGAADATRVAIAAAGGIEPLIALLGSASAEVQKAAAGALLKLAFNGVCRGDARRRVCDARVPDGAGTCKARIVEAGGRAALQPLLRSPSGEVQTAAREALGVLE